MDIEIPGLLIINSEQGGGKTHLIRYLMHKYRHSFDFGIVFTNTYFEDGSFDYIDKKYVHPEYNPDILANLMKLQMGLIIEKTLKEAFVIFDDSIEKDQFACPILKNLCTQLRHYHIMVIFATQYANILPTWMRANTMSVVIFKSDSECNLKALFASYGQGFGKFERFKNYIAENLGDYKFIFYDKKASGDIAKKFPVMRCPAKIPKFKLRFNTNKN